MGTIIIINNIIWTQVSIFYLKRSKIPVKKRELITYGGI